MRTNYLPLHYFLLEEMIPYWIKSVFEHFVGTNCGTTVFNFSGTSQFDLMHENELFAFTLFFMAINDSVHDQIGFRTLCRNEMLSKT